MNLEVASISKLKNSPPYQSNNTNSTKTEENFRNFISLNITKIALEGYFEKR